jgi:hypothetical protein
VSPALCRWKARNEEAACGRFAPFLSAQSKLAPLFWSGRSKADVLRRWRQFQGFLNRFSRTGGNPAPFGMTASGISKALKMIGKRSPGTIRNAVFIPDTCNPSNQIVTCKNASDQLIDSLIQTEVKRAAPLADAAQLRSYLWQQDYAMPISAANSKFHPNSYDKWERRGIEPTLTHPANRHNPHKCGECPPSHFEDRGKAPQSRKAPKNNWKRPARFLALWGTANSK